MDESITSQTALPAYSRSDLDLLKTFDRERILSILAPEHTICRISPGFWCNMPR